MEDHCVYQVQFIDGDGTLVNYHSICKYPIGIGLLIDDPVDPYSAHMFKPEDVNILYTGSHSECERYFDDIRTDEI